MVMIREGSLVVFGTLTICSVWEQSEEYSGRFYAKWSKEYGVAEKIFKVVIVDLVMPKVKRSFYQNHDVMLQEFESGNFLTTDSTSLIPLSPTYKVGDEVTLADSSWCTFLDNGSYGDWWRGQSGRVDCEKVFTIVEKGLRVPIISSGIKEHYNNVMLKDKEGTLYLSTLEYLVPANIDRNLRYLIKRANKEGLDLV